MNPSDQREPGIFEPRTDLPKIINCAGLNKMPFAVLDAIGCTMSYRYYSTHTQQLDTR